MRIYGITNPYGLKRIMKMMALHKSFLITGLLILSFKPVISQELTLEMIYKYNLFNSNKIDGLRSMNDGMHYTFLDELMNIVKQDYMTGNTVDTIFSVSWYDTVITEISSYNFSGNEKTILIGTSQEKIYRYSYQSFYFAYLPENKVLMPLYPEGMQRLATLSPDGNHAAFILNNNLYIKNLQNGNLTAVTSDGLKNHIINGAPDWVYEEEFSLNTGYYWSPDSKKIAFYRFDESEVKEFTYLLFDSLYPSVYTYKYPKAGEASSKIGIFIYDLEMGTKKKMDIPENDVYVPFIEWLPSSEELCISTLNRKQNNLELQIFDIETGKGSMLHNESDSCFVSEPGEEMVTFVDSGKYAIIKSGSDGYLHIYRYTKDGQLVNQITRGPWEVDDICGIDEQSHTIYYTSTEEGPAERGLFSISFDGSGKKRLSGSSGTYSATFSKTFDYYIRSYSDANNPEIYTLHNINGDQIRVLEDNALIIRMKEHFRFTPKQFFTIEPVDGIILNCYKILPPDFKRHKKYPVLIFVYGGPESQSVSNKWESRLAWFQYLAQRGYIIMCTDNRGTSGQGQAFSRSVHHKLGVLEVDDQIALANYAASQNYVDKDRIGIFGWSYGGYLSLLCMEHGNNLFSTGIAVAPVTDWKLYDNIYTERYMGKPDDNEEGYLRSSVLTYSEQIKGKLLLIHGLADDNVHFQHSAMLIKKLKDENKEPDLFIYPDENHLMRGENTLYHVYNQITKYILKNL